MDKVTTEPTTPAAGSTPAAPEAKAPEKSVLGTPAEPAKAADGGAKTDDSGTKAPESKEQTTVVPEKYDLKLPEGALLDASHLEKIEAFAKDKKLSNEDAQAILERENAAVATYAEAQKAQVKKTVDGWRAEAEADKEIGGAALKENAEHARRVVERFGSEKLKHAFDAEGFGNHPELVRIFSKIGKAMADDKLVIPGMSQGSTAPIEDRWYPKTKQE